MRISRMKTYRKNSMKRERRERKREKKNKFRNEYSNSDEQSILCNIRATFEFFFSFFFSQFIFIFIILEFFHRFFSFFACFVNFPNLLRTIGRRALWIVNSALGKGICWFSALLPKTMSQLFIEILKRNRKRKRIKVIIKICIICTQNKLKINGKQSATTPQW